MQTGTLQDVFERPGPFATAYLDTSADAEDAAKAIELRWRAVRERLQEQGADPDTIEAMSRHLREHRAHTGQRGQVMVATGGEVVLVEELPVPPTDLPAEDQAYVGPLPHLMPYLRRCDARVPQVIADIGHTGADLQLVRGPDNIEQIRVDGEEHPVHKVHSGKPENQQRLHMAVEERWKRNAEAVAAQIVEHANRIAAQAIVLTGEDQQRMLVRSLLGETSAQIIEPEYRDETAEQLREEVNRSVLNAHTAEVVEEFRRESGRGKRAVEGWPDTSDALRKGQVRTLIWTADDHAGELRIGPLSTELADDERVIKEMGDQPIGQAPASAAVVRALAGTDAELVVAEPDTIDLTGGIGAVLRYSAA